MTDEEKKFMSSIRGRADGAQPRQMTSQDWGREGGRVRWGDHGKTKCVRAFEKTVDRFRAAIPHERDRAAAATAALDAFLDARGAPKLAGPSITINAVLTYRWYGEIESGRKTVEYRDIGPYWDAKLWAPEVRGRITAIRFSRGYTDTRMTWEVKKIDRNDGEGVYEIHLGRRIL